MLLDTSEGPLDVLCEIGEGQDHEWLLTRADSSARGGSIVRVVDLPTLVALKKAAGRPKDRVILPARSPKGPTSDISAGTRPAGTAATAGR